MRRRAKSWVMDAKKSEELGDGGTWASPPRARERMSASSLTPMVAETVKMDCQLVAVAARPKAAEGISGMEEPVGK
jgi:hypothetical protein